MEEINSSSQSSSSLLMCTCDELKNVQRVSNTGCNDDANAVAALPNDWVPRHSGPILANYLKEREQNHHNVYKDITKLAAVVNNEIDGKIRTLAENLLAHINQNQLDIECAVKKCYVMAQGAKEARDKARKTVNDLYLQRIDDIAFFKREASSLERERANNLNIILRDTFHRLITVGHMTPKELLHDFDERIYEINQQLLSNSRAFVELEAQLRIQVEEDVVRAKSSLNQLSLGIGVVFKGRHSLSAAQSVKDFKKIAQIRSHSANRLQEVTEQTVSSSFLLDKKELDAWVARLVQAYRSAVHKVYIGYYSKLGDLQKDLQASLRDCSRRLCEVSDFQELIDQTLQRLSIFHVKNTPSRFLEKAGADITQMQTSLWTLGESLQNTYLLLEQSGHLWDAHMLRSALAQKITIAAVEDLLTSNDAMELTNEIPFGIALEQMRCAPDVDKLNQQYDALMMMLTKTSEMYAQHSEAELGRLEQFMTLPTFMANILLSEFYIFLEKYPRKAGESNSIMSLLTPTPRHNIVQPLSRAIYQTELQQQALENWRNGFLESFEHNISLIPDELSQQAQQWVEERSKLLHMRYSLKMMSHSVRAERVTAARDARLAELRLHETRLDSHLNAVYNLVESLPIEASEFATVDAPFLYPLVDWVERIQTSIDTFLEQNPMPEVKKMRMSSYPPRLIIHRRNFEESLDKALSDYRLILEQRVQEVRISSLRFMSQIKLFSEGGKYAAQEAIKTSMLLTKASDALELCAIKALDALKNRRAQLLSHADHELQPLMRVLDEAKLSSKSATKAGKKK